MSTVDERELDAQVERRLRAMYAAVVPLLDDGPPVLDTVEEDVGPDHRAARRTGRLALVAASVVVVAGLVLAQRVSVTERNIPAVTSTATTVPAPPAWYEPLRAPLPVGFDQLAVVQVNEFGLSYVAFRTESNQVLEIRLGLDPIFGGGVAIEPATFTDDAGEYSEVTGAVRLRTSDDRTITVRCGPTPTTMGPAAPLGESMVSMCADPAQDDPIDAPALRAIARGLAAMPVGAVGSVVIEPIPAEVRRRAETDLPSLFGVEVTSVGDMYDASARVLGWGDDMTAPSTVLTVIGNVFGPPAAADAAASDEPTGRRVADAAGVTSLLVVSGHTAAHLATTAPTDGMIDQLTQLVASTTVPGEVAPGTTTPADATAAETKGPLDFATTERALPLWPSLDASDPAATTTGYGMHLCDSGYGTKVLRVDPATGPAHAYSGTLCVFIELDEARPDAITTCATTSDRFHYARCQRRTDRTDTAGAGTAVRTVATPEQQTAMTAFPTATAWDQPEMFDVEVGAAGTGRSYRDGSVGVALTDAATLTGVDPPGVCFLIDLAAASADGCVGRGLLATGLAYGAFEDGDGPVEIIGIVPDDVTAVEIDGHTVIPTDNVWHHTADDGAPLIVTVRSADGRTATTK